MTSVSAPIIQLQALAADCPIVKKDTQEVIVKEDSAQLRTEPRKDSQKGPSIKKGDRLQLINHQPTDANNYCWYEVKPLKDTSKTNYWIADVGLSKFALEPKDGSSQSNLSSLSEQNKETQTAEKLSEKKDQGQTIINESSIPWQLWLTLALVGIGTLSSLGALVFSYLGFSLQKENSLKIKKDIQEIDKNNHQLSSKINNQLETLYRKLKEKIVIEKEKIDNIENQLNSLTSIKQPIPPSPLAENFCLPNSTVPIEEFSPVPIANCIIDEVILQFNQQDRNYFSDSRFQPLGLSKASSQGVPVGEDGSPIVQLESLSDTSQALFLQIMLDGENWLIPNIISPYIRQIINNLEEYSEIFSVMESGTGKLTLIKPAKLKNVDSGLWEIAEIGEFQR